MTAQPRVNIVIPTYMRPAPLARTLGALAQQTVQDFVVTVVDDANPEPVANNLPDDLRNAPWLRVLRLAANRGPARARNVGAGASNARFLAFVDDDVVPREDWLETLLARAKEGGPGTAVFGPLVAPPDWRPTAWTRWEADTLAREYARMTAGEYAPTWRQFFTGNALLWRRDFDAVAGFNESFTRAEDIELAYRLFGQGCRFVFVPDAAAWHYAERSAKAWLALPRHYARFDMALDALYPELDWLAILGREWRDQSLALRASRTLLRGRPCRGAAWSALRAARAAHAAGLAATSTRLLSLAYTLAYHDELRNGSGAGTAPTPPAERAAGDQQPAVNSESTRAR